MTVMSCVVNLLGATSTTPLHVIVWKDFSLNINKDGMQQIGLVAA